MIISPYIYPILKHFMLDKEKYPYLDNHRNFTPDDVADVIIKEMNAPVDFRNKKSRNRNYTEAKKIYCKICVFKLNMMLREVGDTIEGYDHSDVIHAHRSFDNLYSTDDMYMNKCNKVLRRLNITL
jgi:chromosomal replication initiation ATPase DnaA